MRKLKLLIAAAALLVGGALTANAYTTSDLTSAGWTQVTESSITGVSDNYYVLVDANSSAYVMSNDASHFRPCYKTIADPVANPSFVWMLEGSNNKFYLKSASTGAYFKQASGWNTSVGYPRDSRNKATIEFTASDGKYSLKCIESNALVGHWNDNGAAVESDGENIAANKAEKDAPGFYLYSISKATFDAALVSSRLSAVSAATKASPVEITSWIQNADWSGDWGGWECTLTSSGNMQWGQHTLESWSANNVVVKQELIGVPNGLYRFVGDVISGPGAAKAAYVFATGDEKVSSTVVSAEASENNYTTMSNEVAGKTLTADNVYVSNNEITVGLDQSTGWVVVDNFKLFYYGPTIKGNAVEFTTGNAVAVDQWYYFDVAATGDYAITSTGDLTDIVYTTDGTILIEDEATVTANPTAVTALTVGRIYFKAANVATITIAPDTYSYEVNAPTASIADASYIKALTTISFDFTTSASTNDPAATFALLNSSATASLKLAGAEVATGALSLDGKVLTATFSGVSLSLGSTYTVEIAADVVGYESQATNAAISTSFKTGTIAEGVYYFKKKDADLYITRGGWYGTEGVVDNFGLSFEAALQSDGTYTLKNVDHSLAANADKFLNGSGSTYTDQGAFNWIIEATEGGYYLRPSNTEYMVSTPHGEYPYSYLSKTTDVSAAYVWNLLNKSEYATALAAAKNKQAAAIAAAAGVSATTVAELESTLASDFGATDMTSNITNAALTKNMDGWTQVKYNGVTYKDADANGTTAEIWNSTGGVKQEVTGLPKGLYKVTVVATWRPGNMATATRVGAEANTTAWMYANTATETNITQLKSWYEGGASINSRADLVTNKANYINTTYVYVADGESLTIGLASPSFCVEPWFPFFDWKLTRYEAKPTAAEKQALEDAITAAEANTLGFETGEYAPYNNIAALEALTAAKALDTDAASGAAVVEATTALTGATWTANTAEVNAIYWKTDYTAGDKASDGYVHPIGWTNTGYNTRIMCAANDATANPAMTTIGTAVFSKFNTTYGETTGYTMPLKAGKIYKITFKYCGWGNNPTTNVVLTDPESNAISLAPGFKPETNDGNTNADHWYDYTGYFVSTAAGNYVLALNKVDNGQQQIAWADMQLVSATEIEFADGSVPTYAPGTYPTVKISRSLTAGKWATAIYPFEVSGVDGLTIANLNSYNGGTLDFSTATASEANKPFLMKAAADKAEISVSDVAVAAAAATDVTAGDASLKGVYASTDIDNSKTNYVMSSNSLYPVGTAGATIPAYRAYIQLAEAAPARLSFAIDGQETTGIEGISVVESENGVVYNLQGQRVMSAQKGLYIKDGKKVVRK
ncbi:MAG: hypothetical protein J6Z14_02845 [Prevotella sp.]|nr:hypothetical protein [Prevotella sp.]